MSWLRKDKSRIWSANLECGRKLEHAQRDISALEAFEKKQEGVIKTQRDYMNNKDRVINGLNKMIDERERKIKELEEKIERSRWTVEKLDLPKELDDGNQ